MDPETPGRAGLALIRPQAPVLGHVALESKESGLNGASPERQEEEEDETATLLCAAARQGRYDVAQQLLSPGTAAINRQDAAGRTPLFWATEYRHEGLVELLLSHGADPDTRDHEGNLCLHRAAYTGAATIARMLLEAGSDLNATNHLGNSPLHLAAQEQCYECLSLFLACGAVSLENKAGQLPQQWAQPGSPSCRALQAFSAQWPSQGEQLLSRDISRGFERVPIPCLNVVDKESYPRDFLYITGNVASGSVPLPAKAWDRGQLSPGRGTCAAALTNFSAAGVMEAAPWPAVPASCAASAPGPSRVADSGWIPLARRLRWDPSTNAACCALAPAPARTGWCKAVSKPSSNFSGQLPRDGGCAQCRMCPVEPSFASEFWSRTPLPRPLEEEGLGGRGTQRTTLPPPLSARYFGELISNTEAARREEDTYYFVVDMQDGQQCCLDGRYYGNVGRFLNHSCQPNLVALQVALGYEVPGIAFFSTRAIQAGEELGFDYGDQFWEVKSWSCACLCGSPGCRRAARGAAGAPSPAAGDPGLGPSSPCPRRPPLRGFALKTKRSSPLKRATRSRWAREARPP